MKSVMMICASQMLQSDEQSVGPRRERMSCHLAEVVVSCRKRRRRLQASSSSLRCPRVQETGDDDTWRRPMQAGSHYHQLLTATTATKTTTTTTTKTSQRQLFINLICAITIIAITASNLLLVANATESDNSNLIRGTAAAAQAADGSQSQSQASQQKPTTTTPATSSNSSSTLAAATTTTTTTTTTTPPTSTSSADSTPNLSAVLRRDLGAKSQLKQQQQQQLLQLQQQSAIINAAGQARKSDGVCQVNDGESVAIIEIEESRGSDTSQTTNPSELPISGSVALGEIELKIESETHKYFHIEDKSLRLTRPLDRDAILKENSTQILQQPITSIYLQISCVDKRSHNHHNQDAKRPIKKKIIPVLVKVLDLNDNAPKFSQPIYSVQVNELAPIGTVILDQLAYAVDLDSANNGQIEYSLLGSSPPAAIATTNKPWSTSSAASLPTSSQMGGTSGLLLGPTSKSIMPPKLATPSSTNQRLVQRAEPASSSSSSAQNQEQQVTATNRLAISTVSSSTSVMNNTVSTTMSPPSPPASSGSSSSSPDSKVSSTNEPQIGPGGTGNESSTPYDYEEGDSGLSQSVTVPTLLQDNLHASRVSSGSGSSGSGSGHSRDLAEPTINLNSEPILNGPMEDSEEDESDEALLASIEAGANNSTDSDGGDQPPIGDQSDLAAPLAAARAYFPRLGKLKPNSVKSGAPGAIPVHQRRRIKRTRRQLPEGGVSPGVSVEPAALEESPSLMTTAANKRRPQSQQTTATTLTTTTMSNAMSPAASTSGQQPPWTNLMVIPSEEFQSIEALDSGNKLLASARQDFHREEDDTSSGSPLASSFASNDFFELELSSQTNRPVIRLKRQLDYETKRVHQLTLVATDRAHNKNERLSSQVKIVIRVLDGDDQPPAFILDQVGCATGLVTQPTSPLPPLMADHVFSVEETTTRPSTVSQRPPLSSAASSSSDMPMRNGNHSSASSLLLDLLQQEAVNMQQHLSSSQSSSPSSRSSSAGAGSSGADPGSRRLSALTRPSLRSPPASIAGGDLTASSTNLRLRSFKVTDENFDFGDTLGLDDTPLDSPEVAQGVQGDEDQMASVVEPHHHHHKQQMPQARTRRITIAAGQPGQQYQQPTSPGSGSSSQLLDYSCLAPLTAGYKSAGASTSGQQLAEYFATVISGDSDYLLRVAPQSIKARDRDELNAPIRYSFINGTPSNYSHYFQINPLDATIKQVAPIERSQVNEFVLFIQAQEQSYNKLFSVAKLTIDVLPTDKSPPVLVPNSYSGFVNENSPIGSRVLAWAPALKSVGPPNSIIGNHRSQPNSTTNANSDPNEQPTPPAAFLRIAVLDADKVPAAAEEHGASAGDLSTKYIAHASTGKQAKYEFETTSEAFKVDRDGFVYVNRFPLDRDPPSGSSVYMLQVTARQVGLVSSRSISSPISLNITIGDLNDNPPQLLNSTLGPIQMTANSRGGAQPLIKIEALDRDLAENSQMRFSIQHVSNMGSARFRIDEDSGRIEALGKFQAGEQFSLTVQVADELGRSSQGILDVQVVPGANTGGPQFLTEAGNHHHQHHHHLGMGRSSHGDVGSQTASQASSSSVASLARASYYSVEVNEGVAVNSAILQVRAIDPENDPITYSIIDGNINNDFSINSKTGTLMVANKLDREEISAYKLIVQARDSGGLANSRPIHVLVTDSNDQNPIFNQAQYVFAVEEGVPAVGSSSSASDGYLLGRVSAHDSDEGENGRVSYSLVPLDSGTMTALAGAPYAHAAPATAAVNRQPVFAINSTTGEIRLMQPLDYEQARSHTLLVVAHDNGENPRSSSAMVQVRVLDRQDETPYFEQFHLETRLDENQANQRVALVQARDPDSVAEVTYVLLGGDSSLFQVDPQTGLVTTIGAGLDYEQARLHSLLIGTNESLSKIDLAQATQRLNEAIAAKQTGTTNGSQSPPLERSALIRVDVLVNDLNDNVPQFESGDLLMPVRVQDSVALGSVLPVQIRAHDHDASSPNNQIRYELVTSASASSSSSYQQQQQQQITTSDRCAQLFLIDPSTGQISVRADLKRDSQSECQLIIRARDMPQEGQPSLSSQISLTVYIDHLIEISSASLIGFADSSYTVELGENEPANTLVKLLTIINKPKVATFPMSCEIISGNELGRFYVTENEQRDCELRTRDQLLDYEQRSRFTLVVKLNTVGGGGIGSASGSSGGGSVYHSNINNSGSGSSGGPVTTTSSRSTLAQIQINILDKNDNKPVFSNQPSRYNHLTQNKYLAAIAYDSPSETQLIQLRATDLDSSQANGLISYELLNEQELEGRFKIDAMDGILRTSRPIEDIPQAKLPLRLRVLARDNPERASDSLEASAEVVVNLIDDHHRIALVMKDTPATRVLDNKEELLSVIQERTGLISGLERVESLKVQRNLSLIEADVSGSDVWFYLIEPGSLRIVPSDDPRLKSTLFEARAQNSLADIINQNLGFAKARVRLPYSLTNALNANSQLSSSNLLFGAIRADSNDRLAPILILVSLFIAIISAIVVIYQCGSVAGFSASTNDHNHQQQQQQQHSAQLYPSQLHQHFAKDKFLFSPPPPPPPVPSQYQFVGSTLGSGAGVDIAQAGAHFGSLSRGATLSNGPTANQQLQTQQHALNRSSFGPATSKEYETQMLKMSVLFDDNQSFDDQNNNENYMNVNKNLV